MLKDWQPLFPAYGRALSTLRDQRKRDPLGMIGWDALKAGCKVRLTTLDFVRPMVERRMVEGVGPGGGRFFARATDFGLSCLDLGIMPRDAVPTEEDARRMLAVAIEAAKAPPAAPSAPEPTKAPRR